jgi:hypothetical protein
MHFDGSALRQASSAPLPFRSREVTLVRLGAHGDLEQARTVAEKQALLDRLVPDDGLLAAWTGRYYTDVFWSTRSARRAVHWSSAGLAPAEWTSSRRPFGAQSAIRKSSSRRSPSPCLGALLECCNRRVELYKRLVVQPAAHARGAQTVLRRLR